MYYFHVCTVCGCLCVYCVQLWVGASILERCELVRNPALMAHATTGVCVCVCARVCVAVSVRVCMRTYMHVCLCAHVHMVLFLAALVRSPSSLCFLSVYGIPSSHFMQVTRLF